jgi:hypothetical protein
VAGGMLVRIPLPIMTVIIAGLALGVEVLGLVAGYGQWSLALLAIPGVLAAAYLLEYRTLPYEPWHPAPRRPQPAPTLAPAPGADEEEFVDPVEEADRLDSAAAPPTVADATGTPDASAPGGPTEPE